MYTVYTRTTGDEMTTGSVVTTSTGNAATETTANTNVVTFSIQGKGKEGEGRIG